MSTIAKGITIAVLASAGLAAPIVATVTYFQTKPANTALTQFGPEQPSEPLATMIAEPDMVAVKAPPPAPHPQVLRPEPARKGPAQRQALRSDPSKFELALPRVDRPAELGAHPMRPPSVDSNGMPPPISREGPKTLQYEEQLR